MKFEPIDTTLRRHQVLAFIMERLVRERVSPTAAEIARKFQFSEARAKQLIKQLIAEGAVARTPGAKRGLRVCDVSENRHQLQEMMRRLGWCTADPLGPLQPPLPNSQLSLIAVLDHIPGIEAGNFDGQPSGA